MRHVNFDLTARILNWDDAPEKVSLPLDELHVWVADLFEVSFSQEIASTLSRDEAERAARFHFESDRANFIAARGSLRTILAGYTGASPASLQFNYSANGKPSLASAIVASGVPPDVELRRPARRRATLQEMKHFKKSDSVRQLFSGRRDAKHSTAGETPAGTSESALNFNLSHSDGLAVFAFARNREIGIDVESLRPFSDMEEVAARCFSSAQQADLRSLKMPAQEKKFFRYWTRKEAILKCVGGGFFDSQAEPGAETPFDGIIQELKPSNDCMATLAVRGKPFLLKMWTFCP